MASGPCTLSDEDQSAGKYAGRTAGVLHCGGLNWADEMLKSGYAVPYSGEKRGPWAGCAR